ncbi:MAG: hypothetical protein Q7S68_01325 [Deltaproteobacteria bacterium]|nr:hypothetical protein [Deltaproteobacteria bacterium]
MEKPVLDSLRPLSGYTGSVYTQLGASSLLWEDLPLLDDFRVVFETIRQHRIDGARSSFIEGDRTKKVELLQTMMRRMHERWWIPNLEVIVGENLPYTAMLDPKRNAMLVDSMTLDRWPSVVSAGFHEGIHALQKKQMEELDFKLLRWGREQVFFPTPVERRITDWSTSELFSEYPKFDLVAERRHLRSPREYQAYQLMFVAQREMNPAIPFVCGDQKAVYVQRHDRLADVGFVPASTKIPTDHRGIILRGVPGFEHLVDGQIIDEFPLKGPLGYPMRDWEKLLQSRSSRFYHHIAHSKPLAVAAHSVGAVVGGAFCGYDVYNFLHNVAFEENVSDGLKMAHGASAVFSVGSFAAGLGEMFRRIPLGTFSAGLGAIAGMVYSGIDVYETVQRVRRGEADKDDFYLSLANFGLASVPTAVFGATMFGLTVAPLALAAAGASTVGAMGLGIYRSMQNDPSSALEVG